jgi:hypothetical protein
MPPDGPTGPITVTITATDTDGLTASTTFTLTVNNLAPTITTFMVPSSGTLGFQAIRKLFPGSAVLGIG